MHLFAYLNLVHTLVSPLQTNENNAFSMKLVTEKGILLVFSGVTSVSWGLPLRHVYHVQCGNALTQNPRSVYFFWIEKSYRAVDPITRQACCCISLETSSRWPPGHGRGCLSPAGVEEHSLSLLPAALFATKAWWPLSPFPSFFSLLLTSLYTVQSVCRPRMVNLSQRQ